MKTVRIVVVGVGNLGRRFLGLIAAKESLLASRYGLTVRVVGVADSTGTAIAPTDDGFDLDVIVRLKEEGGAVCELSGGIPGGDAATLVATGRFDVLCEASPVRLDQRGEPALSLIREALTRGIHVITPNKGPIVLAGDELRGLAEAHGAELRFDGTVAGGLPALYVGTRDLRGAVVQRILAVPNLATGYVLDFLGNGVRWEEACRDATNQGVLEGDGAWDLDGWDAAAKLVILTRATMGSGSDVALENVQRTGIREIDGEQVRRARRSGGVLRLLATAEAASGGSISAARLTVIPTVLGPEHPLSGLGQTEMGVVFETDIYGTITLKIDETTPLPSAATMLRDLLDIYS